MLKTLMALIINPESDFLSEFFSENIMLKIITAFHQILTSLCTIQKSAWFDEEKEWKPSKGALETYKFVSRLQLPSLHPLKLGDIKSFFSSPDTANVNFFEEKKVLYLPPLKRDADDAEFVPIFSLSCNLNRNQSMAKFRVMLVTLDTNDKTKLNGVGFRMETPDGTGIHDFHHAQLIHQFSPKQFGNILQIKCLSWLPESQPSFPLPADCPVTLLLCIMITLYGWEYYTDFCDHMPTIHEYRNRIDSRMGKKKVRRQRR